MYGSSTIRVSDNAILLLITMLDLLAVLLQQQPTKVLKQGISPTRSAPAVWLSSDGVPELEWHSSTARAVLQPPSRLASPNLAHAKVNRVGSIFLPKLSQPLDLQSCGCDRAERIRLLPLPLNSLYFFPYCAAFAVFKEDQPFQNDILDCKLLLIDNGFTCIHGRRRQCHVLVLLIGYFQFQRCVNSTTQLPDQERDGDDSSDQKKSSKSHIRSTISYGQ